MARVERGELAAVLFRRWVGKGGNFRGHLFLPLHGDPSLLAVDAYDRQVVGIGGIDAVLGRHYRDDWFFAYQDVD